MGNQKKPISELGYARSGGSGKTLADIDRELQNLDMENISNANDVPVWERTISDLFRIDLGQFNTLRYSCCKVSAQLSDFPADLKETDSIAYVFTHRNSQEGIQILVGAQSGIMLTRRKNEGKLTEWTYGGAGGISGHIVFEIDPSTGFLSVTTQPGYMVQFSIENGYLVANF